MCNFVIIKMNMQMPVIREVEKRYNVRIPIIALTADTPGEETRKMLEAGMDDYLSKPLQKNRLLETMARLVGN